MILAFGRSLGGTGAVVVLTLLLTFTVASAAAGAAEPQMLGTMPAQGGEVERPPGQARVVFDVGVDPDTVEMRVEDEAGERVDGDDAGVGAGPSTIEVSLPADLPAGFYTVTWHSGFDAAAEMEGSWRFHVLEDPETHDDASGGWRVAAIVAALLLLLGASGAVWFSRSRLA